MIFGIGRLIDPSTAYLGCERWLCVCVQYFSLLFAFAADSKPLVWLRAAAFPLVNPPRASALHAMINGPNINIDSINCRRH